MVNIWDIAKKHNRRCKTRATAKRNIDALVARLQQQLSLDTDPLLLRSLLNDTLFFDKWKSVIRDKTVQTPQEVVESYRHTTTMHEFIQAFKRGLVANHPVLCEMGTCILEQGDANTSLDPSTATVLKQTLHIMYIFEAITRYACQNSTFTLHLINYYYTLRWSHHKSISHYMNTETGFPFVKAESVMWALDRYYQMRVVHQSNIRPDSKRALLKTIGDEVVLGLNTNVYEAVIADKYLNTNVTKRNARAGINGLLKISYGHAEYKPDTIVFPQMTQLYASMYTSWNLCFVSPYDFAPLLYGKLLFPYLTNSPPQHFIFRRAISLMVAVNSVLCTHLFKTRPLGKFAVDSVQEQLAMCNLLYANEMFACAKQDRSGVRTTKRVLKTMKQAKTLCDSKPFHHYTSRKKYKPPPLHTIYTHYTGV